MSVFKIFCFGKALKNKDNICNLKPFAQGHLLFVCLSVATFEQRLVGYVECL